MARTKYPTLERHRPRKYPTPEHMQQAIDEYFDSCFEDRWREVTDPMTKEKSFEHYREQIRPFTITGLALSLGFATRESLLYYEGMSPEFLSTIQMAKMKCQQFAEEELFRKTQVAGVIFNLKNNYGWQDRIVQEVQPRGAEQESNDERAASARQKLLAMTQQEQEQGQN